MNGERVEDLRIALRPGVVDHHFFEAPFPTVAHKLAIVTIHQERVLRARPRTFSRHEMLREHVRVKRCRIVADLDLKIASRVTGIERAEQRNQCIDDSLAAVNFGKSSSSLRPAGRKSKTQSSVNADVSESASP